FGLVACDATGDSVGSVAWTYSGRFRLFKNYGLAILCTYIWPILGAGRFSDFAVFDRSCPLGVINGLHASFCNEKIRCRPCKLIGTIRLYTCRCNRAFNLFYGGNAYSQMCTALALV